MYPLVDDLIKGRLNEQQVDQVWAEMLQNTDLFAYYRTQIGLSVELNKSVTIKSVKSKKLNWWYAVSAAAILILSISAYFFHISNQYEKEYQAFIAFNAYDLESFDAFRAINTDDSTFNTMVTQATTALLLGDVEKAVELYTNLINNNNYEVELKALLHFNRALVFYAKKDYNKSLTDLETSLNLTNEVELENKIDCQKLKVFVAQGKLKEAKSFAQECLNTNLSLTKSQRAFIEKIAA